MIEFHQASGDEYEAIVMRHPEPEKEQPVFKVFPERTEYRTGDLYTRHTSKPDLWLYRGRGDDIIVFLTGEKTNPISMEEAIARHPEVRSVLVLGTLRFQAALLVELATDEKLSTTQKAEVIERLWPTIQEANKECPRHAQIKKSHILFTDLQKPMQRAGKGTIQRRPTIELYKEEIDELYADADKLSVVAADVAEASVNLQDSKVVSTFISETLIKLTDSIGYVDSDNFFISGMDSLQAVQLTRSLKMALAIPHLEISTVYANPSIPSLTKAIMQLSVEHESSTVSKQSSRSQTMEEMLRDYQQLVDVIAQSQMANTSTNGVPATVPKDRVILLTGSTGAIGSYIVHALLDTTNVSYIYCLNRASDSQSLQVERSKARGLPTEFSADRVTFLTADWSKDSLGLDAEVYERLRSTVTDVIHNAWPVNFNLSLSTFAPQLSGVINLLKLAASTSHSCTLLFISSISSVLAYTLKPIPEEIITDPRAALPMGYAESKYLTERILDYASIALPTVNTVVVRVGQVAGPAFEPGNWNKWEWFPSLVISSLFLGMVPDSLGKGQNTIDWVPIDFLAGALVDLTLSNKDHDSASGGRVFHPVNPQPTTWSALMPIVVDALNKTLAAKGVAKSITAVPLSTWIECVREEAEKLDGASDLEKMLEVNPAVKLLGFYEGLNAGEGFSDVDGKMAIKASEKLNNLEGLKVEWMEKWIQGWVGI
jgi:nucleoside-diphosphate-sugar epimerase